MKQSAARSLHKEQVNTIAPAPSGAGAEILAVTEDDFFLLAVRRVVTLPNRVWHATSDAQAADMLMSTPCAVVLLDIALVPHQLEAVVTRLRQQLPELGFVIAGEPQDAKKVADLIDNGEVQGFIVKEEAAEKLATLLESGINRHLELRTSTDRRATKPAWQTTPVLGGIAAVALALIGTGVWLLSREDAATSTTAGDEAAVLSPDASQSERAAVVDTELQKAREAFEAGRYVATKGGAALDHYRAVLAADPANGEARDGLHRITEVMLARAEVSLLEAKPRDAATSIKTAKEIEPGHPRIAFLESQVTRELDRSAAAQQEAAKADALNAKLAGLIKLGNERITQDRLSDPGNDSARYYFNQARELDSGSVLVLQSLRSLANKMVQKSQQAAARGDTESADQWLAQARALNVSGIDFGRIERDVKTTTRKSTEAERLVGLARARLNEGQLLDPENDSARFYVYQLRQQFPDAAGTGPVVEGLRTQLLAQASEAAARNDLRAGQRFLDEAKALGASGASFDQAAAALNLARRKSESLATPVPVRDNMVVKSVTPEYPARAQRKLQEGYVDLQFTSTATGEVKDITVVAAQPEGVFDDAAVRALKRWKFKPKEIDGQAVDQRLALRMRFELADEK